MVHNHIIPEKYRGALYAPASGKVHAFQEVNFKGRKFKMRKDADLIIDWIQGGREAEGMVSKTFEKILRLGKSDDPAVEQGLCTPHAREQNGGKHAVVLDIGANAGFYGMYAAAVGCRTYFFDIQTECLDWINTELYENKFHHASLIPHPVGNVSQTVHLDVSSNGCHGTFTLSKTGDIWYKDDMKKQEPLDIDMVRLDDIFHDAMHSHTLPPIALIKLDTEGFEGGVIASMHNLARHVQKATGKGTLRNLVSEVAPERWPGLPGGGLTREQVATIYCETLWDAGFQDVQAFGFEGAKRRFKSRSDLFTYIASGKFSSISEDFLFTRTHTLDVDEELPLFH
jgi:FkbM family methyltransferase